MTSHRVPAPGQISGALTIKPFQFDEIGYCNKVGEMDAKALLYEFEQVLIDASTDRNGPTFRRVTLCRREVARRLSPSENAQ